MKKFACHKPVTVWLDYLPCLLQILPKTVFWACTKLSGTWSVSWFMKLCAMHNTWKREGNTQYMEEWMRRSRATFTVPLHVYFLLHSSSHYKPCFHITSGRISLWLSRERRARERKGQLQRTSSGFFFNLNSSTSFWLCRLTSRRWLINRRWSHGLKWKEPSKPEK